MTNKTPRIAKTRRESTTPGTRKTGKLFFFLSFFLSFFFRQLSSTLPQSVTMVFARNSSIFNRAVQRPIAFSLQSISVAFEHCVLRGLSRKLCSASMTLTQSACMASRPLRIPGRVVSVKLHPQEVPAARGHAYAMFKRNGNRLYLQVFTRRLQLPTQ